MKLERGFMSPYHILEELRQRSGDENLTLPPKRLDWYSKTPANPYFEARQQKAKEEAELKSLRQELVGVIALAPGRVVEESDEPKCVDQDNLSLKLDVRDMLSVILKIDAVNTRV